MLSQFNLHLLRQDSATIQPPTIQVASNILLQHLQSSAHRLAASSTTQRHHQPLVFYRQLTDSSHRKGSQNCRIRAIWITEIASINIRNLTNFSKLKVNIRGHIWWVNFHLLQPSPRKQLILMTKMQNCDKMLKTCHNIVKNKVISSESKGHSLIRLWRMRR